MNNKDNHIDAVEKAIRSNSTRSSAKQKLRAALKQGIRSDFSKHLRLSEKLNKPEISQLIIAYDIDSNEMKLLFSATEQGDLGTLQILKKYDYDFDKQRRIRFGQSMLLRSASYVAIKSDQLESLKFLIKNSNKKPKKNTWLEAAAALDKPEIAKFLLDKYDYDQSTLIYSITKSSIYSNIKLIELLYSRIDASKLTKSMLKTLQEDTREDHLHLLKKALLATTRPPRSPNQQTPDKEDDISL